MKGSQHKKANFRRLPGDIPKAAKIELLAKDKTYKRERVRRVNRSLRRQKIDETE